MAASAGSSAPDIFELDIRVRAEDIDQLGHVNNISYIRWVQDAAVAHWRAAAASADQEKLRWMVLRHEVDYKQPAYLEDAILARTWVGQATRLRFERHTELLRQSDRTVLAKALTIWCPIDATTGKPVAMSAAVRSRFSESRGQ